jgi:predicted outer membrane protein
MSAVDRLNPSPRKLQWLTFNTILSFLIAILSVITALAAYRAAAIDSTSTDNYFLAQSYLNDSNALYLEQGQDIVYDFSTYDAYVANDILGNEELSGYYYDQLSDELLAGMEREEGPFDDTYYTAMYKDAQETLELGEETFDSAAHDSNRAVAYQLTVLIMAVGLSFAAWASLSEKNKQVRFIFTVLSVVALVIGLGQMLSIPGPLL